MHRSGNGFGIRAACSTTAVKSRKNFSASVLDEELAKVRRFASDRFDVARELFDQITTDDEFVEFLTLPGYEKLD